MCNCHHFRTVLSAVGVIGVLLALAPYYSGESNIAGRSQAAHVELYPDDTPVKEECRLGWNRSALVLYRYESTLTEEDGQLLKRETRELKIGWASLSSLTLVAGLGFLWMGGMFRSKPRPVGQSNP
jgi:hypothetical protein